MERFELTTVSLVDTKKLYVAIRQCLVNGFFMQVRPSMLDSSFTVV